MRLKNILFISFILVTTLTSHSMLRADNGFGIAEINTTGQKADDIITHTVAKGETVYSIAAAYNTTVMEIYKLNPNAEKGIKIGDKLKIRKVKKAVSFSNHVIEAKETLYSVARMYHISVEDLKNANSTLTESTFSVGRTILIPSFDASSPTPPSSDNTEFVNTNAEYIVQKGETLYSIGKKHNVSVEALMNANTFLNGESLREGMTLTIPSGQAAAIQSINKQERITETPSAQKGDVVKVGILLPFLDENGSIQKEKLTEYYEGFLLAVKTLKEQGLNAEIYTFDIGSEKNTEKLESLLGTAEINNLHLIIGGVSREQIDTLTKFSKKTGIKYAIPFGSTKEIESIPTLFQLTTSHASLYPEAIKAFKDMFGNQRIIFISCADNDKVDFTNALKQELKQSNIKFETINNSDNLLTELKAVLNSTGRNVLIPSSSSETALRKMISVSNSITSASITFFGYPEWQAYPQQNANLSKYDAYIYSTFFLDWNQKEAQNVSAEYKKWYTKSMINSYPKFGYLGYDAGLYFLSALNKYGSNFENNISNFRDKTLQSAIHFQKISDKGGYINNGLYIIHYLKDSGVEKIDVSK